MEIVVIGRPSVVGGSKSLAQNPVLLYLAVHAPGWVRRDQLLAELWPDDDLASASNRFRVALSRLRKFVPIQESPDGIRLDPREVRVDFDSVRTRITDSADEPDSFQELANLEALLPQLRLTLFEGYAMEWALPWQTLWSELAFGVAHRLILLGNTADDPKVLRIGAELGLAHFPNDEELWTTLLQAMARLGDSAPAQKAFAQARRKRLAEGDDFSEDLRALAEAIGQSAITAGAQYLPLAESHLINRFFAQILHADPELATAVLGSPAFRALVVQYPQTSLNLLRAIPLAKVAKSEARERVEVRIITCVALLHDEHAVIELAESFLARPVAPARRRIALLSLSYAYFHVGRSAEAFVALDEAHTIATETGFIYDAWQIEVQRANLLLLSGDCDAAKAIYSQAIAYFDQNPLPDLDPDLHTLWVNFALANALTGASDEALQILQREHREADPRNPRVYDYLGEMLTGWCHAQRKELDSARQYLRRGLRLAYRANPQAAIFALGFAVEAVEALSGEAAPAARLDWAQAVKAKERPTHGFEADRLIRWGIDLGTLKPDGRTLVERITNAIDLVKQVSTKS